MHFGSGFFYCYYFFFYFPVQILCQGREEVCSGCAEVAWVGASVGRGSPLGAEPGSRFPPCIHPGHPPAAGAARGRGHPCPRATCGCSTPRPGWMDSNSQGGQQGPPAIPPGPRTDCSGAAASRRLPWHHPGLPMGTAPMGGTARGWGWQVSSGRVKPERGLGTGGVGAAELELEQERPAGENGEFPPSSLRNAPPVYLGTGPGRGFVPFYWEERGINYFLPTFWTPSPHPVPARSRPCTQHLPVHPGTRRGCWDTSAGHCPCQQRCFSSHPSPSSSQRWQTRT